MHVIMSGNVNVLGWSIGFSIRSAGLSDSRSAEFLADAETSAPRSSKTPLNYSRTLYFWPLTMDRQLFAFVRFFIWIFIILCFFAICFIRSLRPTKENCLNLGLFSLGGYSIYMFSFIILHYSCLRL